MEEIKRGRGRPRLDVPNSRRSRRHDVNTMYINKAVQLISEAAAEIPETGMHKRNSGGNRSTKSISQQIKMCCPQG